MPEGVIVGAWQYVVAAYLVTGGILAAYAASLLLRRRAQRRRALDRDQPASSL